MLLIELCKSVYRPDCHGGEIRAIRGTHTVQYTLTVYAVVTEENHFAILRKLNDSMHIRLEALTKCLALIQFFLLSVMHLS